MIFYPYGAFLHTVNRLEVSLVGVAQISTQYDRYGHLSVLYSVYSVFWFSIVCLDSFKVSTSPWVVIIK